MLMSTYSDASTEHAWDALFATVELFRCVATPVAQHFSFEYPQGDGDRVTAHLKHVRHLPPDATEIY